MIHYASFLGDICFLLLISFLWLTVNQMLGVQQTRFNLRKKREIKKRPAGLFI